MRILVTGGSGFIGSNLVPALQARGHEPIVYDLNEPGTDTPRVIGDVTDCDALCDAMSGADAVVHLAAVSGVADCEDDPIRAARINVGAEVLTCASRIGIERLVYASSMAAVRGDSWYGATKKALEALADGITAATTLRCIGLRFSNVYGPNSRHKTSVVATWMRAALQGRPLQVHDNGTAVRDFIYITDVCSSIIRAMEREPGVGAGGIKTWRNISVGDLAAIVADVTGADVDGCDVALYEPTTFFRGRGPCVALEDGIVLTWGWYKRTHGEGLAA